MEKKEIIKLIVLKLSGNATTEQLDNLENWGNERSENSELLHKLESELYLQNAFGEVARFNKYKKRVVPRDGRVAYKSLSAIVASIAAVVVFLSIFITLKSNETDDLNSEQYARLIEQQPVIVEDDKLIVIKGDINDTIYMKEKPQKIYQLSEAKQTVAIDKKIKQKSEVSVLITPKQMTHKIELSDGTVVRVNANSKLKYQSKFDGDLREVTLSGEAFFDVAKDVTKPFIVNVNSSKVMVYGTSFNVRSDSLNGFETTLLSGSVAVKHNDSAEVTLKPGETATLCNGEFMVERKNTSVITAWLNNTFIFEDSNLDDILGELNQWYDVKFDYNKNNFNDVRISGKYNKELEVDEILESISKITSLIFIKTSAYEYEVEEINR